MRPSVADPHLSAVLSRGPSVALAISCPAWERAVPEIERLSLAAARLALKNSGMPDETELSLVLTDDREIRELNRAWRGQDKPTNVLSFPGDRAASAPGAPVLLGDVIVAYETACREVEGGAAASLSDHLAHLIVHGVLHLVGHDHEEDTEAEAMERLESRLLAELGIPDPYHERRSSQ